MLLLTCFGVLEPRDDAVGRLPVSPWRPPSREVLASNSARSGAYSWRSTGASHALAQTTVRVLCAFIRFHTEDYARLLCRAVVSRARGKTCCVSEQARPTGVELGAQNQNRLVNHGSASYSLTPDSAVEWVSAIAVVSGIGLVWGDLISLIVWAAARQLW